MFPADDKWIFVLCVFWIAQAIGHSHHEFDTEESHLLKVLKDHEVISDVIEEIAEGAQILEVGFFWVNDRLMDRSKMECPVGDVWGW